MKKFFSKFFLVVVFFILLCLVGCNENKVPERKAQEGTEIVTLSSTGATYNNKGFCMEFDDSSEFFTIEPFETDDSSVHSSTGCDVCGYEEYNDRKVYHVCDHTAQRNGFILKLKTPIKASSVSGILMTYMASADAKSTEARIFHLEDTVFNILNESPFLYGATENWVTADLNMDDMETLADEDGYIRGFKIMIRNKDRAHFYINSLTFKIDAEYLSNVEVPDICLYEIGATTAIAEKIRDNFQNANIASEITVYCESYLQNSSLHDGEITYSVDIKVGENKTLSYYDIKKEIPHLKNKWLEGTDSLYGAVQTIDTGWKKDFNNGGIMSLSDREISCAEGVDYIEYAVIKSDSDYKDENVEWFKPQLIEYSEKGIKKLHINAFLDYGDELQEGESYKLIVRGVSNNQNYIVHINHNFTYTHYSSDVAQSLINAYNIISQLVLSSDGALTDSKTVKEKIQEAVNNSSVIVNVDKNFESVSTNNYKISLSYNDDKFKPYTGKAFTIENFAVWKNSLDANAIILPVSPFDGQSQIVLASEHIVKHMLASYEDVRRDDFENYISKEVCTPLGIIFSWSDKNAFDGKEYTLIISESDTFENTLEYSTADMEITVYNLKNGIKYYWKVVTSDTSSPVFSFETSGNYPRYIKADGVMNIRDIGGYITTEGKIIKQGLIYRSANLDEVTKDGIKTLTQEIGIKTDLDLREDYGGSPLGKDVNYMPYVMKWYGNIFGEEEKIVVSNVVKVFADETNYPIDYHCQIGRDRTGTLTVLLLGLLGVDEETIIREYLLSFYSQMGDYNLKVSKDLQGSISLFISQFDGYGDENSTFREKVENYLLDAGVTREEMDKIRTIMLEDAPVNSEKVQENSCNNTVLIVIIIVAVVAAIAAAVIILMILRAKKAKVTK